MNREEILAILKNKKVMIPLVGIILCVFPILLISITKKQVKVVSCNIDNCLSGCCIKEKCQEKGYSALGYTCLGKSNWQTPEGSTRTDLPSEIIQKIAQISISPADESKESNMEIAEKVLEKIDKEKDETGIYYYSDALEAGKNQQERLIDNRVGIYPIWAKLSIWEKTKDKAVLEGLTIDLDALSDLNKVPTFQPELWSCKILYDLWISPSLSQETKEKAKKLCERALIMVPALDNKFTLTSETKINQIPEKDLNNIFKTTNKENIPISSSEEDNFEKIVNSYSAYSSDFSTKFLWEKKENNLKIAKSLFNLAVDYYDKLKTASIERRECILGIAALDLYKMSNEQKYLDFAQNLYIKNSSIRSGTLLKKTTCYLFASDLNKITPDKKYGDFMTGLLTDIRQNNYNPETKSFYDLVGSEKVSYTRDNSLAIKVLY